MLNVYVGYIFCHNSYRDHPWQNISYWNLICRKCICFRDFHDMVSIWVYVCTMRWLCLWLVRYRVFDTLCWDDPHGGWFPLATLTITSGTNNACRWHLKRFWWDSTCMGFYQVMVTQMIMLTHDNLYIVCESFYCHVENRCLLLWLLLFILLRFWHWATGISIWISPCCRCNCKRFSISDPFTWSHFTSITRNFVNIMEWFTILCLAYYVCKTAILNKNHVFD